VPLPSRRPAPTANVDNGANWIKPLAFVNLRERPSPSARVISVIPKGAKLRAIGRKDRWVQVTHSATSERGWIYAVNERHALIDQHTEPGRPRSTKSQPSMAATKIIASVRTDALRSAMTRKTRPQILGRRFINSLRRPQPHGANGAKLRFSFRLTISARQSVT
jgi:Bacterial SH3 domain